MKKSLLALAVLGAVSGIASAQTSVTIYGVADAGLTRERYAGTSTNRLDSGNQSGDRLGFKGNEDLGGGLSAQFLLEQGFQIDTGAAGDASRGAFNRQAYLGLTGAFGQIRLGRQKTVMYDTLLALDPFGIAAKGGMDRLFFRNGNAGVTGFQSAGAGRSDNTIAYFTPTVAGFTGEATYAFGEQAGSNRAGRQYGLSANYAAGPLFVTLDYLNVNNIPLASATPGAPFGVADSAKDTLLGATYDFGVVKAHGAYGIEKGISGLDQRDYMVGATVPFGASAVQVDYIRKNDRNGGSAAGNQGAKQFAVGYTYALSKRTNFYSSYTTTLQRSGANFVSSQGVASVSGASDRVLNAGIRHTF
ncbi:MAG: porin [Burkholderiaceae bacterium]